MSSMEEYLYDGDFLELNEDTGAVTIGYHEWDTALAEDFTRVNWDKFKHNLQKNLQDHRKSEQYKEDYINTYLGQNE